MSQMTVIGRLTTKLSAMCPSDGRSGPAGRSHVRRKARPAPTDQERQVDAPIASYGASGNRSSVGTAVSNQSPAMGVRVGGVKTTPRAFDLGMGIWCVSGSTSTNITSLLILGLALNLDRHSANVATPLIEHQTK